jgi:hypothetical protein
MCVFIHLSQGKSVKPHIMMTFQQQPDHKIIHKGFIDAVNTKKFSSIRDKFYFYFILIKSNIKSDGKTRQKKKKSHLAEINLYHIHKSPKKDLWLTIA